MKKAVLSLWLLALIDPALAESSFTAEQLFNRGLIWQTLGQPQKAIEALEESYQGKQKAVCLYLMAASYERLARIPTRTASEALDSKQRALELYERFVEHTQAEEWPQYLAKARARVGPLRQEIEELATQVASDREELKSQLKAINEKLQLLIDHLLPQERNKLPLRQKPIPPRSQ